ncbi:MAG TPA: hypothetical protein VHP63_05085 [candidate division Zixibacteria bacterium]|nr:hypothetical protein [candidate division Zixibacteria bacterium]
MCCTKRQFVSLLCILALLICSLAGSVSAVKSEQTTAQLVGNSSEVIRGKVLSAVSKWDDAHTIIFTEVEVEVSDLVLGSIEKGRRISIYVPGGKVGDTVLSVEHAAQFEKGEDVVVFLTQLEGIYGVTSWEMGKFTVQNGNLREKKQSAADFISEIRKAKQ